MADDDTKTDDSDTDGLALIETDYVIGQHNVKLKVGRWKLDVHNPVFAISASSVAVFVVLAILFESQATQFFSWLRPALTENFDWFFLWAANIFVLFCLFLIISPWGKIRLGGPDATSDFSYLGWFSMLFAAGMGIGLMFFGVLEPVYHMAISQPLGVPSPIAPDGSIITENVAAARQIGIAATIYHWGIHAWAIYAVVALALALFAYNKGLPLTIRSVFYPVLGERVWGKAGNVIDILAVFATLFGLATSLGFGAQQANAGFQYVFGLPVTVNMQVILICLITALALVSVVRGLERGIKILSQVNMIAAGLLLLFVILAAGLSDTAQNFLSGLSGYAQKIIPLSNPHGREDSSYMQGWTAFYWAWWISWSPFVGTFIARVSRGRTVREFITCVLIIPSCACLLWMTAFGGAAIDQVIDNPGESAVKANVIDTYSPELSLFSMLDGLPWSDITSIIAVFLIVVFFVSSSDSGSLVIDTITAGGKLEPPVPQRVFWASFEGLVAIALLVGGGLEALQAMVISTGLPFTFVLLIMCWSVWQGLRTEPR
jgi:BCCT family betaine/carnitine transporter